MRLQVNPHSSIPLYAQIVEQIRNQILCGALLPGSALPSVREISEQIDVNSLTIQKALKILESSQLICIRRGVGAFVSTHIESFENTQNEYQIKIEIGEVTEKAKNFGIFKNRFYEMIEECWEKSGDKE